MKKMTAAAGLFLGFALIFTLPVQGGDLFNILRVRIIPNPVIGLLPGDEVLEVTFSLLTERWVPVGWSIRYYDDARRWLDTGTTAYFSLSQNNPHLISQGRFKGGNTYVALFPLREDAPYLVVALGNGLEHKVVLYPYTALLQDFSVPVRALESEIASSNYVFLEKREEVVDVLIFSDQPPAEVEGVPGK